MEDSRLQATSLSDVDLKEWLQGCLSNKHIVGYVYSSYICKAKNLSNQATSSIQIDPDKKSKAIFRKLAKKNLLKVSEVSSVDIKNLDNLIEYELVTEGQIIELLDHRSEVLGRSLGRGADITTKTAWRVWGDAGGRCMFKGCGEDLSEIPLYNKPARVGYLAHIIASDPKGPRGEVGKSHELSNLAENIMLMCDAHHRLIDCFAPEEYPASKLNEMRKSHQGLVRFYLNTLGFIKAKAVTLHANLAYIPTDFRDNDFLNAILPTGRGMDPEVVHFIRRTQRDDRRSSEFWLQYLEEHELDIRQMVAELNGLNTNKYEELAIFPLHHVSTLILAGRIIGEARKLQVFQYHRERSSWQWDTDRTPQPPKSFNVDNLLDFPSEEVLLTLELTAGIKEGDLPEGLLESGVPWVRITTIKPRFDCISHPDDLSQFKSIARKAINHIHDVMKAKKVHVIAVSPVSTVFCFGQMLQAGHHSRYQIYDKASGDKKFSKALSIGGHDVAAGEGDKVVSIQIR